MSEPITKELREWVDKYLYPYDINYIHRSYGTHLMEIADRIDAEHKRRMEDNAEVVRCKDCMHARRMDDRFVCTVRPLMAHLVDADEYCSRGVRAEVDG